MKSKYIEGTNKQYSIREDGKIIRNYKWLGRKEYGHQEFKNVIIPYKKAPKRKNSKCVIVRSNGKTFNFYSNSLLSKYFGFIICPSCKNKIDTDTHLRKCKVCIENNEYKSRINWRSKNKYIILKSQRKHYLSNIDYYRNKGNKRTEKLHDNYIASKLKIKSKYLEKDLKELKKNQLLLHRELKKQEKL
ncbi:hypothetical protein [Clostridium sp.]|jgi:hypothetical protein|uniref:hypothetical protein n=1 Tax=Clostridium sp. TaxID=1506 RepID=UPI003EED47C2